MRSRPRIRALVLAAGFGTRLRPLTDSLAKPLLPVCGEPVAGHTLARLAAVGCELAVLNLHHRAERVREHFGERYRGLRLAYSHESEILGTLGALVPPRERLVDGADAVVVVNGDALCAWPLRRLVRAHLARGAAATLLLHRWAPPGRYGGGVGVDRGGRVVQLRDAPAAGEVAHRRVFTGAQVLDPALLAELEPGRRDIVADLYIPLLARGGHIAAVTTGKRWHDLGTPERYRSGVLDWARGPWPRLLWRGAVISPRARVEAEARVRRSVLEAGARVAAGTRVERSVLLEGAAVGAGSRIRDSVLGPGVVLPSSSAVQGRLVTVRLPGSRPRPDESLIGDLIYTPL